MPPKYAEIMTPEIAAKYTFIEDGDLDRSCNLPTYQWLPKTQPKAVIFGIHGLTLHGRRYRVLARTMAINGIAFVSMDMLGFGKNRFDPNWEKDPITKKTRAKAHHEDSYNAIVNLATAVRQKFPNCPIIALGESLGCTFAVRLASEHPELVTGLVLSAPAVKVNPDMYASASDIKEGLKAILFSPKGMVNLNAFMHHLVSGRQEVINEMLDDPYICQELSIGELLSTDEFVEKTVHWGKNISARLPLLILQGSADKCVVPKHVTDLMMVMPSEDQRVSWRGSFGHLQLETAFMRAAIIDTIGDWLQDHSRENRAKLQVLEQDVAAVGGTLVQ